jgi:hypothetical protein
MLVALTTSTQLVTPQAAYSQSYYYTNTGQRVVYYARPHYYHRHYGVYQRHPIISRTLTGAAIGTAGGAVVGAIAGHHRAGRGALIGLGAGSLGGLGYGLYRNRQYTGHWF